MRYRPERFYIFLWGENEFLQGEADLSFLLSTGEVHLELCVQCLASHYKRGSGALEWQRARKKIQILQHLSYNERMKELGLFRLKKNWVKGDLINCVEIPGGVCREDAAELFLVVPCDRTRANGHKLKLDNILFRFKTLLFFLWGWSGNERDCPERLWSFYSLRYS